MSERIGSLQQELEERLRELVVKGARAALFDIVSLELGDLAARNPSFAQLASSAKVLLVNLSEVVEQGIELPSLERVKEYIGILDSISQAIVDESNKLLVDCISHLEEFLAINDQTPRRDANGGN